MDVFLNGSRYVLAEGTQVRRSPIVEWPNNIRYDGQQKLKDRSYISNWSIDNWSGGLGLKTIKVDQTGKVFRLWDAENIDTRHSQMFPSPRFITATLVPSRGDLDLHFEHGGQLYFVRTQQTGSPAIVAHRFTAPDTIGSQQNLINSQGSPYDIGSISGVFAHEGRILFTGYSDNSGGRLYQVPTLGQNVGSGVGGTIATNTQGRYTQFADLSGTLHVMAHNAGQIQMAVVTGSHLAGSLTFVKTVTTTIGTQMAPLVGNGVTMYAALPDGVYNFDDTPAITIDTSSSKDRNQMLAMYQNNLYFKNKLSLVKYDGTDLTQAGYDQEDGLPSDKMGQITAMTANWKYIFAAVQGPTYSHILSRDVGGAWQYYARVPTPGLYVRELFLTDTPDGLDRLWVMFHNYQFPGYYLNPIVHPLAAGTYEWVGTGHVTWPVYDGGMDDYNAVWTQQAFKSEGPVATLNTVFPYYALNGTTGMLTLGSLGFMTSNQEAMTFGSAYGQTAYRIQPRIMIGYSSAAAPGSPPVFDRAVIEYLKKPTARYQYDFDVDAWATAQIETRPVEDVLTTLDTDMETVLLMPFYYGQIATQAIFPLEHYALESIGRENVLPTERNNSIIHCKVSELI